MDIQQPFTERVKVLGYLSSKIVPSPQPLTTIEQLLISEFCDLCEESSSDPAGNVLEIRIARWVVRDDDLELFKVIRDAAVTLASTNYVLSSMSTAAVVSLALGVATLIRNVLRSTATLSTDEVVVMVVLSKIGHPATVDEILSALRTRESKSSWTNKRVKMVLKGLEKVVTRKDIVPLVKADARGAWSLVGV
jgi:hypothetical protein